MDVVLTHDAPAGVCFHRHRQGAGYVSQAAGLDVVLARAQPRVCFFGHHNARVDAEVSGVSCPGLNKIACPGNLVAVEFTPNGRGWSVIGEYGAVGAGGETGSASIALLGRGTRCRENSADAQAIRDRFITWKTPGGSFIAKYTLLHNCAAFDSSASVPLAPKGAMS